MADIGTSAKNVFVKAMEGISSAASNVANNTRFRINEMNLTNQRREILESFGNKAYELYKAGAAFPPELTQVLEQIASLDKQLNEIRTEHQATAKETQAPERAPSIAVPEAQEETSKAVFGETDDAAPVMDMPEIAAEEGQSAVQTVADAVQETAEAAEAVVESSREAAEKLTGILDEIKNQTETE